MNTELVNMIRRHRNVLEAQLAELNALLGIAAPAGHPKRSRRPSFIEEYARNQAAGTWSKPTDLKKKAKSPTK